MTRDVVALCCFLAVISDVLAVVDLNTRALLNALWNSVTTLLRTITKLNYVLPCAHCWILR